ncbi:MULTISPECIES: TetR/AcrR family transcriptional regulator [Streptomyces]|uniref:AcrR family transcriptional regulator n=1 Tax=Streptomyces demainii TaxID=588122 RepID=A0ABT9L9I3_9ACTN|nr:MULTISPECIES: TetR/AcrR family transcriptional regulator [Streptomyces]MBW8088367.1 TetR/AcrR family transcriptional regulator [Streptomyces hygroscopicus subsp. hygroscopicus]MCO8307111.1 TetR/AcrR family transcriptional regulator [Streptomyces sp. RKCA744]MDN3055228.1 helix-turn-helix domain containing protein [Streptomyces sp. SRF1]MDP9616206.1 AcrR family transcriptional regulator [Streptomyces demainii]
MRRRTAPTPPAESAPGTRPLRADAERNRQRLIAAARELFARRGLGVTLDDIAHHAGVGVGTAYRRFANREALVEAVFEDQAQALIARAEHALNHADPWDGLAQFFQASARHFAEDRGLREVLLHGTHGRTRMAALRERLAPAVSALLVRAQEDGRLRDDVEATDFPLIQLMLGVVTEHSREVAPELWQRYATLILDGLRAERTAPTPLPHRALDLDEFDQTMARHHSS